MSMNYCEHIQGCLIGTAVGDAIGLPREGIGRRRAQKLFGGRPLRHTLIVGRGLCSDDTEHTVMVAQAFVASGGDPGWFQLDFARRLRWWFLRIPAGIGLGTLRACVKLWIGFPMERSGVRSAGNGPAMRSAVLGLVASSDQHMYDLVQAATRLTHTDSRAAEGALVVAAIARRIALAGGNRLTANEVTETIQAYVKDEGLSRGLNMAVEAAGKGMLSEDYARHAGFENSVSGFVNHTVPAAIYCWLLYQRDFQQAVETAIEMGGDTDTVAAIVGALAGTQVGFEGIPADWIAGLAEWPCTIHWMKVLAQNVSEVKSDGVVKSPPTLSPVMLLLRNLLFIPIVLTHGIRRLFPPY